MTILSNELSVAASLITGDVGEVSRDAAGLRFERSAMCRAAERLTLDSIPLRGWQVKLKRGIDILVASFLLALLAPLMGAIALAIRLSSPGPALFRQPRVGRGGRPFTILKYRTMECNDAAVALDDLSIESHKRRNDARVTPIGHLLRISSLDELPQLINVLRGEMSLVGPRPEVLWVFDSHYEPWQRARVLVLPGITGWWQVNGRSDRPLHTSTEDDIYYIVNWSFWLDLRILIKTVGAVIRGRGAF